MLKKQIIFKRFRSRNIVSFLIFGIILDLSDSTIFVHYKKGNVLDLEEQWRAVHCTFWGKIMKVINYLIIKFYYTRRLTIVCVLWNFDLYLLNVGISLIENMYNYTSTSQFEYIISPRKLLWYRTIFLKAISYVLHRNFKLHLSVSSNFYCNGYDIQRCNLNCVMVFTKLHKPKQFENGTRMRHTLHGDTGKIPRRQPFTNNPFLRLG